MTAYDFAFILDADPHDEALEERLSEPPLDDGTLILQNGAYALSFDREAASYKEAVLSAYEDIRALGVSILSFDPDYLVSATDIAERAGLSKAAISKFVHQDETFPAPFRRVQTSRPLYDWVQVSRWLTEHRQLDVEQYRMAIVSRIMNIGTGADRADLMIDVRKLMNKALETA